MLTVQPPLIIQAQLGTIFSFSWSLYFNKIYISVKGEKCILMRQGKPIPFMYYFIIYKPERNSQLLGLKKTHR